MINKAKKLKINNILLGHHKDDLIENFFIRILRGSGLNGLVSLDQKTNWQNINLIRPLLKFSKINLMEDGIPIAPAPYASPAAYYSPTAGRMFALEARKGSSQIKYGPHSTGGALNYVSTPIPNSYKANLILSGGDHSSQFFKSNIGSSNSKFGYLFEILHDKNSGFKSLDYINGNTGYSKTDFMGKMRYKRNFIKFPTAIEFMFSLTDELSNETYLGLTNQDYNKNPYSISFDDFFLSSNKDIYE